MPSDSHRRNAVRDDAYQTVNEATLANTFGTRYFRDGQRRGVVSDAAEELADRVTYELGKDLSVTSLEAALVYLKGLYHFLSDHPTTCDVPSEDKELMLRFQEKLELMIVRKTLAEKRGVSGHYSLQ